MELTDLPGHEGKITSDKKMIFISHQRYKVGNRDYCGIFETASKCLNCFVRLILRKVGADGFPRPQPETDIRYEFDLKVILNDLGCK